MKYKFLLLLCLIVVVGVKAQNTTNIPISMYGLGELSFGDGGQYAGMGNVGIALNRVGFQNTQNPAAITRMDTTYFMFDFGLTASYSRYSLLGEQASNISGNPNRINLGLRMFPHWYAMVGVTPYSSVGYVVRSDQEVEGTGEAYVSSLFEGTGGLYRFYATNAFLLGKGFSIGTNVGFVSGTVEQTETQESALITRKSFKNAFYVDFGIYYEHAVTRYKYWALGLIYALPARLKQDNSLIYENSSTDDGIDVSFYDGEQYLPQRIGMGVSYVTRGVILTGDYNWLEWSRNQSNLNSVEYVNQHKLNVGATFMTEPRKPKSVELMIGMGMSNSYTVIRKGKMNNLDFSAGIGIPFRESVLSLGFSWRTQMNTHANLMKENRWMINFNLTFAEKMSKGKLR